MRIALVPVLVVFAAAVQPAWAGDEPPPRRGQRESEHDRQEVETAIREALELAEDVRTQVVEALEESDQPPKRQELVRAGLDDVVGSLDRLRALFEEDAKWSEQKVEVRAAVAAWNDLKHGIRHHWASRARPDFLELREELHDLARLYQVDDPAR